MTDPDPRDPDQHAWLTPEQIKQRRAELGLTLVTLANRAGIDRGQLARIESGSTRPRVATLCAISLALAAVAEEAEGGKQPRTVTFGLKTGAGLELEIEGPIEDFEALEAAWLRLVVKMSAPGERGRDDRA